MPDSNKYTTAEIALATGIKRGTIVYRIKKLGISCRQGISYDQVKAIVNFKGNKTPRAARQSAVNYLKRQLKNDGFKVSEK